jgi:hypothetical protein
MVMMSDLSWFPIKTGERLYKYLALLALCSSFVSA